MKIKSGRLFWKFFLFFWLAQLITSVGVGVTIWLLRPEHGPGHRQEYGGHPPPPHLPGSGEHPPNEPPFDRPLERSLLPPLLPLVAGSLVSLVFALLLAAYFARPIRSLRKAFEAAAAGNLEVRIVTTMGLRKDELADLGSDFDRMAERLQGLLEGQRRLLHDVSHELRSPLARLQAAADLMRQQPERGAEFAERIERDTERMDRLVGELLTLARLDSGMVGSLTEPVDLTELIDSLVDDAHFEAEAKGCQIAVSIDKPAEASSVVAGNIDLLHRAIENVVRNALRHSPDGGRIGVTVRSDSVRRQVLIEITDQGPGVPVSDLDAIFAPFFRGDQAHGASGYGLGLAITRRVMQAHGGSVSASNRPEGGLSVVLSLPQGQSDR